MKRLNFRWCYVAFQPFSLLCFCFRKSETSALNPPNTGLSKKTSKPIQPIKFNPETKSFNIDATAKKCIEKGEDNADTWKSESSGKAKTSDSPCPPCFAATGIGWVPCCFIYNHCTIPVFIFSLPFSVPLVLCYAFNICICLCLRPHLLILFSFLYTNPLPVVLIPLKSLSLSLALLLSLSLSLSFSLSFSSQYQ